MTIRLRTIVILMLLAAAAVAAYVSLGVYNVAATVQHFKPVVRLLDYAMRESVKLRAASITVPDLSDARRIRNGLGHYRRHCAQCHGAPGIAPEDFGLSMNPAPSNLVATAREWHASEIYWVVRNGIKMTGMPAWEYRLDDQDIWDIVAFVERLPAISPEAYAALAAETPPARQDRPPRAETVAMSAPGESEAGRRAISQYLCATCHYIPGVADSSKHVGTPLNGIATRQYIAGVLPNNPENMVRWLKDPQQIAPRSAMPNLGLTDRDARDIAAYLYTLDDID